MSDVLLTTALPLRSATALRSTTALRVCYTTKIRSTTVLRSTTALRSAASVRRAADDCLTITFYDRLARTPHDCLALHECLTRAADPHCSCGRVGPVSGCGGRAYRGTSLIRIRSPLGLCSRLISRVLGGPRGVGVFLWARYPCRRTSPPRAPSSTVSGVRAVLTRGVKTRRLRIQVGTTTWAYRGTSLIRKRTPLGPYRRLMPRVLG